MTQYSLVLIVLLLQRRVCLGENCYCFKADELATNAIDDKSPQKCLSSCSTCSENYIFIYKFNVTESCVGRCGQLYDKRDPCQCNTACKKYKNCCDDYDAFCLIESCVGRCEQPFDSNLQCQCNSPCREKQDCCDDYGVFCSEEAKNTHSEEEDVDDATHICPGIGSFIQWDPSTSCINFDQLEENWTGIMRSREMSEILTSTVPDENDKWKPLQCKIKEGGTSENLMLVRSSSDNCSDLMSFYCGNVEFDLNTRSPHNTSNSYMITGVIVGIVSSIIAIGVVICVVIVVRRRRSAIRNPILKQDLHGPNDTEKIEHLENKNGYAYSEIEMETTKKKDYMDNGDNEYTTGTSDVYDHLNENKNRKIKTENPHAIYDHSIGDNAEPDYDSTKHVVPTNPEYQEVRIRSEEESHREKL